MNKHIDIRKAGGVIIRDRKFLVARARGKDFFVAPGGKLEGDETHKQALKRELYEEIQLKIDENELEELGTFYAPAAGNEDRLLEIVVYIVKGSVGTVTPSSEVEEIEWINSRTTGLRIGSIFEHDVMPLLVQKDLID